MSETDNRFKKVTYKQLSLEDLATLLAARTAAEEGGDLTMTIPLKGINKTGEVRVIITDTP